MTMTPSQVQGGEAAVGTVTVSNPAPAGGLVIHLSTDSVAYCVLPDSVTVPPGATSVSFPVLTDAVPSLTVAQIVATLDTDGQRASLTLLP
jgi:hypothetical protein